MMKEKKTPLLHSHAAVSKRRSPCTGVRNGSAVASVEVGEQPVCLGTRGLYLNLEALRGAAPGQGGIGKPVMCQTLILL